MAEEEIMRKEGEAFYAARIREKGEMVWQLLDFSAFPDTSHTSSTRILQWPPPSPLQSAIVSGQGLSCYKFSNLTIC